MIDEILFVQDLPAMPKEHRDNLQREIDSVQATAFQTLLWSGLHVVFLCKSAGWEEIEQKGIMANGQTADSILSHETIHAVLTEEVGYATSLQLDTISMRWGWRYENTGLPNFMLPDERVSLGLRGLELEK